MKRLLLICSAMLVGLLLIPSDASAIIIIDDFDSSQSLSVSSVGPGSDSSTLDDGSVFGGERDMLTRKTNSTSPLAFAVTFASSAGSLAYSEAGSAQGTAVVHWDLNDDTPPTASASPNLTGITLLTTGVDVTSEPDLVATVTFSDEATNAIIFTLFDTGGSSFSVTKTIGIVGSPTPIFTPLSSFTGVSLSSIGAVVMQIVTPSAGANVVISQAAFTAAVPEPSTLAMMSVLGIGLVVGGLRRKRRA